MAPSDVELAAMRRAVTLSAFGIGSASPNPPVGCVILDRTGRAVGEGYHRRKGEQHAEVNALHAAGDDARGGTAVVTLEPCNHKGVTPPCRQALLDAGIARVLVAVLDPTSRGEGGVAVLRAQGVEVETGVLADEARLVLGPWLSALERGRPEVTWAYAVAPDGETTAACDVLPAPSPLWSAYDAVLTVNGPREGRRDAHGSRSCRLPTLDPQVSAREQMSAQYEGGVRTLLLDLTPEAAAPFLAADLVDHSVGMIAKVAPSRRPVLGGRRRRLPLEGFALTSVSNEDGYVVLRGAPSGPSVPTASPESRHG